MPEGSDNLGLGSLSSTLFLKGRLGEIMSEFQTYIDQLNQYAGVHLPTLLKAILILVVGWLAAWVISAIIRRVLTRTELDNRIANWIWPRQDGPPVPIERWVSKAVFYVLLLFVLIAFSQSLGMTVVTEPLSGFLNQVFAFGPRLIGSIILLLVAWALASVLRSLLRGALERLDLDARVTAQTEREEDQQLPLSQTLSEAVYWLVFLFFLPAILGRLGLHGLLEPVQNLVDKLLAFLPQLLAAGLILAVGWFVARIVQRIVTSLLVAIGTDTFGESIGLSRALGKQRLSNLLGTILYVLILVPVLIAALEALAIESITRPASQMLNTMLLAIPNVFAACLVLAIAYMVGKVLSGLVANLLSALGFDFILARIGYSKVQAQGQKSPSVVAGNLVLIILMLFATAEAAELMGFDVVGELMSQFLVFGGHVIMGLIILGVGMYLAGVAFDTVSASNASQARLLANGARLAILVLTGAMALREMGLANEIINLAFGMTVGAIAVAIALAFGLGARDAAAEQVEEWRRKLNSGSGSETP